MPKNTKQMRATLIVSTYNRPDALSVCLDSIRYQSVLPVEVIIGDDGSTIETRKTIQQFQQNFPVPLIHVWQEDAGFRLAMMRNKSIAQATGDYIIEIDGDVFLHRKFIEDHIRLARPKHYLKGTRVYLSEQITKAICLQEVNKRIYPWTRGIESKAETAMHCTWLSAIFAGRFKTNVINGLGCNMSFYKSDFLSINGYDEYFEGWGKEDDDLAHRLQRSGCKKRAIRFSGIVYHLWHASESKENVGKNTDYLTENNNKNVTRCANGVDKYIK